MSEANIKQFYYKPIVDFGLLEKYADGLICTTACIASATSQAIINGNTGTAGRLLDKFKSIFGKNLYVEIQPYKIDKKGTQQKTDYVLMGLARERKIKCILTSDSHFGSKEDFDTYCKMHEIGKTTLDVKNTYSERYMPSEYEIEERFTTIYKNRFKDAFSVAEMFVDNLKKLQDSVEEDILSQCELVLPKIETNGESSETVLRKMVKRGLKKRGKNTKQYIQRCKQELESWNISIRQIGRDRRATARGVRSWSNFPCTTANSRLTARSGGYASASTLSPAIVSSPGIDTFRRIRLPYSAARRPSARS